MSFKWFSTEALIKGGISFDIFEEHNHAIFGRQGVKVRKGDLFEPAFHPAFRFVRLDKAFIYINVCTANFIPKSFSKLHKPQRCKSLRRSAFVLARVKP
jgi:hypothetical protein